jgi:hypothetical protein
MKTKLFTKAGAVLDALCAAPEPLTLKELSQRLDMPVPTLSRLCNDMVEMRWLEKTDYHHFAPGLTLLKFGTHAGRLSPYAASAGKIIRDYSIKSGLNGLLTGFENGSFFQICACAQKSSDHNIIRRSGAFLALFSAAGYSAEEAKQAVYQLYSDISDVEKNTLDREFETLKNQNILLRVGTMRQWYITIPFRLKNISCALTFYGQGEDGKNAENACGEVANAAAKIRSAWSRLDDK